MDRVKQVILIRRDLKMRRGKEIAQGSHAAMEFLVESIRLQLMNCGGRDVQFHLSEKEHVWFTQGTAKVCLQVTSEAELLEHHQKALEAGLKSCLIQDSGRTEFHGIPTYTACAIGPDLGAKIDDITGQLSLY